MIIKKKTKHVRYTAPDLGAVFDEIAKIVKEEVETTAVFEAWAFYDYLKKYIEANRAKPEGEVTKARDYRRRRSRALRGVGREVPVRPDRLVYGGTLGGLLLRRIAYEERKRLEGYGDTSLIRTGHYLANIGTRLDIDGTKTVGKVRINPDATTDDGFSLQNLAKLLEYGYVKAKSFRRPSRRGYYPGERVTAITRIPARPHWRPALLWYRATRRDKVPKILSARIIRRITSNPKWRT